jgi:hypothetical protein
MTHYVKVALIVIVTMAVVSRIPTLKTLVLAA